MAKNKVLGRPKGPKKVAVTIFIAADRKQRLKEFAAKEQKTQSIIVENSLEATYGI